MLALIHSFPCLHNPILQTPLPSLHTLPTSPSPSPHRILGNMINEVTTELINGQVFQELANLKKFLKVFADKNNFNISIKNSNKRYIYFKCETLCKTECNFKLSASYSKNTKVWTINLKLNKNLTKPEQRTDLFIQDKLVAKHMKDKIIEFHVKKYKPKQIKNLLVLQLNGEQQYNHTVSISFIYDTIRNYKKRLSRLEK